MAKKSPVTLQLSDRGFWVDAFFKKTGQIVLKLVYYAHEYTTA